MARTITSANSIFMLSVEGLYPTPRQIQGYSADNMFGLDPITSNVTSMGIDGLLSGGFVHSAKMMSITLQADSLSNDIFERWHEAMIKTRETMIADGLVTLPAINRKFTLTRGFLTSYSPAPTAGQTLQPRQYQITWGAISPAPML